MSRRQLRSVDEGDPDRVRELLAECERLRQQLAVQETRVRMLETARDIAVRLAVGGAPAVGS